MDQPILRIYACEGGSYLMRVGVIDRIGGQLTCLGCRFIVSGIPEGHMFREISLIWEIPDYQFDGEGPAVT